MTDVDREALIRQIVARPYEKVVRGDDLEGYLAEAPEFPGCVTAGETPEEALAMLRDAMEGWVESTLTTSDLAAVVLRPSDSGRRGTGDGRQLHLAEPGRGTVRDSADGMAVDLRF